MKISQVIRKLEKAHIDISMLSETCDGVIYGNTDQECTGIVVTCCSTADVIRKTASAGCNLLITHEPTFYHGYDKAEFLRGTEIYEKKRKLIEENGIVIWRDHDRVHREQPDMVYSGIIKAFGWESCALDPGRPFFPITGYTIPETTLEGLGGYVGEKIGISGMRCVGTLDMPVKKVGLAAHFFGGEDDQKCIRIIEEEDYDAVIALETMDWTITEYIMDCTELGRSRGLLTPGHFNLEEAGMRMMTGWISKVTGGSIPVTFIRSGNMYRWIRCKKD